MYAFQTVVISLTTRYKNTGCLGQASAKSLVRPDLMRIRARTGPTTHPHASSDPKTKPPYTAFQLRDSVATHCKLGGKW